MIGGIDGIDGIDVFLKERKFKWMFGVRGVAIKYHENNEAVFSDICTRSEGGGDVEGNKNCRW